jgi:hypothetical protein
VAERQVDYVLNVKSTPGTATAFDDLVKKAEKLERQASRARDAVGAAAAKGGTPSSAAGGAAGAAGGGESGALGLKGMKAAAAEALFAVKLLEVGLTGLATGLTAAGNASLTAQQRIEKEAEAVPIPFFASVGKALRDVGSAIEGTPEKLRLLTLEFGRLTVALEANAVAAAKIREGEATLAGAKTRVDVTSIIAAKVAGDPKLQATLAAEHDASNLGAQRRAMKEAATLATQREVGFAGGAATHAEEQRSAAQDAVAAAAKKYNVAARGIMPLADVKSDATKVQFQEQVNRAQLAMNALKLEQKRLTDADVKAQQTAVDLANKKADLAKIETEFKRQTLKAAHEELTLAEGSAAAFAKLRPNERSAIAAAIGRIKAGGTDAASDMEKEMVGGVFPKFMEKELTKTGMADPGFKDAMVAAGMRTTEVIKKEIAELRPEVTVGLYMDEKRLAEELAKVLGPAIAKAEATAKGIVEAAKIEFELQQRAKATQQQ